MHRCMLEPFSSRVAAFETLTLQCLRLPVNDIQNNMFTHIFTLYFYGMIQVDFPYGKFIYMVHVNQCELNLFVNINRFQHYWTIDVLSLPVHKLSELVLKGRAVALKFLHQN